ncbi:MAG: 5-methylthioadenosine/S-adenosylhomocysteine deaminase, partial [Mycobacterium sp.]|nr:5-methylthioadenosine/S-adenosylhomocysteine deaminase [Mycobacterium sp.]
MTVLFRQVFVYDAVAPDAMTGPTDVLVEDDRISAVGDDLPASPGARIVEGGGRHLLVPGLINAHFHSPANHLKGSVRSLPLELFMLFESPADPALAPGPREAYLRTMLGAIEMLQRGITCVQDDAFLMPFPDPEIIDAVASAYRDSGIRAYLALDQPELTEAEKLPFTTEVDDVIAFHEPAPAPAAQLLEAYDHLVGTWHGAADDRIRAAVSISAPQRVSLEYFAALDDLAERHGLPLYAHMLETKVQRTLMTEQPRFAGRSLVGYTAAAGLLKPHTNVIHAVWVDDADLDAIADAGSTVVHNPVSNLRLGSGVLPWRAMLDRHIPVALGTDEAICDDTINVWTVAKTAGLIHNVSGLDSDEWPTAAEILEALWRG